MEKIRQKFQLLVMTDAVRVNFMWYLSAEICFLHMCKSYHAKTSYLLVPAYIPSNVVHLGKVSNSSFRKTADGMPKDLLRGLVSIFGTSLHLVPHIQRFNTWKISCGHWHIWLSHHPWSAVWLWNHSFYVSRTHILLHHLQMAFALQTQLSTYNFSLLLSVLTKSIWQTIMSKMQEYQNAIYCR